MAVTVVTTESQLNAWATARAAQAVYTEDEWAEIPAGVDIPINSDFSLTAPNAAGFFVGIRPQAGAEATTGRFWPIYGGARATISVRDFSSFTIRGATVRVRGLQCRRSQSGGGSFRYGNGARYEECIIHAGPSGQTLTTTVTGGGELAACLLVGEPSSSLLVDGVEGAYLSRCTIVANGSTSSALRSEFGELRLNGCALFGFSSDISTGSVHPSSSHNATSRTTAIGSNGQTSLASADFVSTASGAEDYRRAAGSTKLGNVGAVIASVTRDFFGNSLPQGAANDIGAHELPEAGDTTAPTITGPGGSANGPFAVSTTENTTTVGTYTASEAVTWTKTGTDEALYTLTPGAGNTVVVAWASAPNFDSGLGSNPKTFTLRATDAAGNQRDAPITNTVTDVNEAPVFSGTISVPTLTQGTAMTPISLAGRWTDPEGNSLTYALAGSWPAGLSISGGSIQGTPSVSGTFSGLSVTASDGTNAAVASNTFPITVNTSGGGSPPPPPPPPPPPTATITLYQPDGTTPAAPATGLRWAWFDQARPDLFLAPTARGTDGAIGAGGVLTVNITGTALAAGAVGWLEVANSDGNPASDFSGWGGPVARS